MPMFNEPCWKCRKTMLYVCKDCGGILDSVGVVVGNIKEDWNMDGTHRLVVEWKEDGIQKA